MSIGVVVGVAAICVMALIGVLAGVIAAVSTVSGIDTRDNEGDWCCRPLPRKGAGANIDVLI